MFEQWLGPEKFRDGVRRYVAKHAWGNATADDFFAALAATDDARDPGVPRIRRTGRRAAARRRARLHGATPTLALAQQRFVPVGVPRRGAGERWVFPACFEYRRRREGPADLHARARRDAGGAAADTRACPQWVVANRTGLGYYLPRLTPALYAALPKAERVLAGADYAALLGDLAMLARSGRVGYQDALPLAARQANSPDPRAARRAFDLADDVPPALVAPANAAKYAAWMRRHFGPRAHFLGWLPRKGESPDLLRLRETAVPLVAVRGPGRGARARGAAARAALARRPQRDARGGPPHRAA